MSTNHVLEYLRLIDTGHFAEALTHFEPDAMIISPSLRGGEALNFQDFSELVYDYERTATPEQLAEDHEVDKFVASGDTVMAEGFVTGPSSNRYFLISTRLAPSGLIQRYSYLTWQVEDEKAVQVLRA
ncbi:MAG: hypothetical protein ACO1NM_00780 [Sphingobium phenoxybenzoativorans]|uniref:hypothetical protein n=1 Tax=Sphingobium phenoxybenzoativorans TaxID=1592790 RepID=UPI00087267C5|nr:hypothetical protein [Sphingobium phenoxybenzoativorans]